MSKDSMPPVLVPLTDIRELAKRHNMVSPPAHEGDPYRLAHMMAALLHGWNKEEYHQGLVSMTEDDYLRALSAAESGEVHAPANRRPLAK